MNAIAGFLSQDHKRCDEMLVQTEHLAAQRDITNAGVACRDFIAAMENHFGMEEEVLFPAFEGATGSNMGPTSVMRHEHEQMRSLFREMMSALETNRDEDFLGLSETLFILMQQHNAKEEHILYPGADRLLQGEHLVTAMRERR